MPDGAWENVVPVGSSNLHMQIALRLEEMILSGQIKPGARLPSEQQMAAQFGVSRSVVRDAIRVLSARHLVKAHQGKPSVVTHNSRQAMIETLQLLIRRTNYTLGEMIELRSIIEPQMASYAARTATQDQIQRMEDALTLYRVSLEAKDLFRAEIAHRDFHTAIIFSNQNHLIQDVIGEVIRATTENLGPLIDLQNLWDDYAIHADLLDAIKRSDPEGAQRTMILHMQKSAEQLAEPAS